MSKAMRKLIEHAQRAARCLSVLSGAALLTCGCAARPEIGGAEAIQLPAPLVQPEPAVSTEVTSLQRYQELSQFCETEKSRNAALETSLAEQKAGRQKAEAENENLRRQVETLNAKARELDAVKAKLDEAQKASLEMENAVRDMRRELLQERLAGVKRDQTIVALKIEKAREARKPGAVPLSASGRGTDKERGATALPEKAAAALPPAPKAPQPAGAQDVTPSAASEVRQAAGGQVTPDKAAPQATTEKETEVANP